VHVVVEAEGVEQPAQVELVRDRQRPLHVHLVLVAAPDALPGHVAAAHEVGDDLLRRALGDVEHQREVADADARIVRDAQERPSVIGEEAPRHCC
jgi:hypothetical protein